MLRIGYGHYALLLRPLGGSGVLLQTNASLAELGIPHAECKLLMDNIRTLQ
jgi:hypothetical protein